MADPLKVSTLPQILKMHLVEMLFTTNRDVSKRTLDHKNRIHFLFTTNRDVPITFWSQKSGPFFGPRPRFRWFKIVHFCLKIYMVNENNPMGYPMLSLLKKLAILQMSTKFCQSKLCTTILQTFEIGGSYPLTNIMNIISGYVGL